VKLHYCFHGSHDTDIPFEIKTGCAVTVKQWCWDWIPSNVWSSADDIMQTESCCRDKLRWGQSRNLCYLITATSHLYPNRICTREVRSDGMQGEAEERKSRLEPLRGLLKEKKIYSPASVNAIPKWTWSHHWLTYNMRRPGREHKPRLGTVHLSSWCKEALKNFNKDLTWELKYLRAAKPLSTPIFYAKYCQFKIYW